jgi:hypothetical protein
LLRSPVRICGDRHPNRRWASAGGAKKIEGIDEVPKIAKAKSANRLLIGARKFAL